MDPILKRLMSIDTFHNTDKLVEARSNFLKSIYESDDTCTKIYKELPIILENEPSIIITSELSNEEKHPEFNDINGEIILTPASVFEEKNGVLSAVVCVNGCSNHYISDTITTKELVDKFNTMLKINPSAAYTWITENTVTYKSIKNINESSVYTIKGLIVDKDDNRFYITKEGIKANTEREAYAEFNKLVRSRYPEKYYDLHDVKVVNIINDCTIIRPELHSVNTADHPNITEGIDITGCVVKIVGMEDRVFNDTVSAFNYLKTLPCTLINDKLRIYDKFGNDITSEFGL